MHIGTLRRNKIDFCVKKIYGIFFLAAFIVFVLAASSNIYAAGTVKAFGVLTTVEDDGTVVINEKGYRVSPSADLQDPRGNRILPSELLPSSYVHFEYEQTPRGFVIINIKEIAQ
jgi:hypothetical protein